jgi:hypothetical protein
MSKRRRWLLGITLALVAGVMVVWSILPPGGQMAVTVVFIGYTNVPINCNCTVAGSGLVTNTIPLGVFMATNTGSVPVKIFSEVRFDTTTNTSNFAPPLHDGTTGPLRPGDGVIIYAMIIDSQRPCWTELAYCRYGLGMRMHDKLWNTGNPVAQGIVNQLSLALEKHWTQSGWITNPPSVIAASAFLWSNSPWNSPWISRSAPTDAPAPWKHWAIRNIEEREQPARWDPYVRGNSEEFLKPSDAIDASGPPTHFHITAPPDWSDIDLSDLDTFPRR